MATVPYVPVPSVDLAGASGARQSIDGVSAAAFGGPQADSLRRMGSVISDSLDWLAKSQQRDKNYDMEADVVDYRQRSAKAFEDAQNNNTGDGRNFLNGFMEDRKKDSDALLAKHGNNPQLNLRLKQINFGLFSRALPLQARKTNDWYKTDLGDKETPFIMGMIQNPDEKRIEIDAARFDQLVDKTPMTDVANGGVS